jgi:hypothetical protein
MDALGRFVEKLTQRSLPLRVAFGNRPYAVRKVVMHPFDISMDEPLWSVGQAARAAGAAPTTISTWYTRGHLWLAEQDKRADQNGLAHKLSLRTVLRIGAMQALVAQGVPPQRAGQAAKRWTDSSRRPAPGGLLVPARNPGELFGEGETILCCFADGSVEIVQKLAGLPFDPFLGRSAVTAVILNEVDEKVRAGLARPTPAEKAVSTKARIFETEGSR